MPSAFAEVMPKRWRFARSFGVASASSDCRIDATGGIGGRAALAMCDAWYSDARSRMPGVASSSPIVLITGGSRGIGAATVRLAAARGYAIAFTYLERAETAHALVHELTATGGTALAIQADVSLE